MSSGVSQVKKRFAEMATYLHKDEKGQQLLKLLKDDVNVLRKSLAAAEAAKDTAVALMETARQRADKAETAAVSLVESNKQLQDQNNSLQSQVVLLSQKLATADGSGAVKDGAASELPHTGAVRAMRRLRRLLPKCPRSCSLTDRQAASMSDHNTVFRRAEIVEGWSTQDMWLLGATVAVVSGVVGHCVIFEDDARIRAISPTNNSLDHELSLGKRATIPALYRFFLNWFTANIESRSNADVFRDSQSRALGLRVSITSQAKPRAQLADWFTVDDNEEGDT